MQMRKMQIWQNANLNKMQTRQNTNGTRGNKTKCKCDEMQM